MKRLMKMKMEKMSDGFSLIEIYYIASIFS